MNDDFLKQLRAEPRLAFARDLRKQLARQQREPTVSKFRVPIRRFAWAAAAVGIVCTLIVAASPSGRAGVINTLRQINVATDLSSVVVPASEPSTIRMIGGITYEEVERLPTYDGDPGPTIIREEEALPIAEANARLPAPLKLPTWAPADFSGSSWVTMIAPDNAFSHLRVRARWSMWEQLQYGGWPIYLHATYPTTADFKPGATVGKGAVEEVQINGRPAALVRGSWNASGGYSLTDGVFALNWVEDGVYYQLEGSPTNVSVDELIKMAESIR